MNNETQREGTSTPNRKRQNPVTLPASPSKLGRRSALLDAVAAIHATAGKQSSPESVWKSKKQSILDTLEKLQSKPGKADEKVTANSKKGESDPEKKKQQEKEKEVEEKPREISPDMKMNVQLMNGELPQCYVDLITRFTVVDLFLKKNYPRMMLLSNIHNYLVLSDCKLSFLEKHVQNIIYLFAYKEEKGEKQKSYVMGRTVPKLPTERSVLMLKLPTADASTSTKDQLLSFLSSSKNLSGVFATMKEEERKADTLHERTSQLKQHICDYISDQYEDYLVRSGAKRPDTGRAVGFTMSELGEMPEGEIPPPVAYQAKSIASMLSQTRKEMEKEKEKEKEKKNVSQPSTPQNKPKKIYRKLEMDLRMSL